MTLSPHAVVVGIDLSGTGEPALEWAAAEAHRRGLPLRIVHAYPPPTYPATGRLGNEADALDSMCSLPARW